MLEVLQNIGIVFGYLFVWLLCAVGVILSCLSISGTWVVTGAALMAALLSGPEFPGWGTVVLFALLSGVVEFVEAIAGVWGVRNRGGSHAAGFAALGGCLLGAVLGGMVAPILGSIVGMLIASFVFAYLVERHRLKESTHAAHIAFGAVTARLLVMFVKLAATMGMIVWLAVGIVLK